MPICTTCSASIIKLRPQEQTSVTSGNPVEITLPPLQHVPRDDCWICTKFSKWLAAEHPEIFHSWGYEDLPVTYSLVGLSHINRPQIWVIMLNFTYRGFGEDDACGLDLDLVSGEEFITCPLAEPRLRFDLDLPRQWIDKCQKQHSRCAQSTGQWYPTRLLHLTASGQELTLIISKDHLLNGPYITLSHRWGPHMKLKLTQTTIADFLAGIPISELCQIFQDAVTIAQKLGVLYLWIDALCIIQDEDDHADWNIESKTWHQVYENGLLNISITLTSGDESVFGNRKRILALPSEMQLDVEGNHQSYFVLDSHLWQDEVDNAPLNNRAWVFQERFSARRVLHVGSHQAIWECREMDASEMFPAGLHVIATAGSITKSSHHDLFTDPLVELAGNWRSMVEKYTKCGMTKPTDKLVAFNGIVQAIVKNRGGRCVAGVWEQNLAFDLCWFRFDEMEELFPISETSFRAPSWSWASVDGPIRYPVGLGKIQRRFIEGQILEPDTDQDAKLYEHPYIRLQGRRLPLRIKWADDIISFETAGFKALLDHPFGPKFFWDGREDKVRALSGGSNLQWIPLFAESYSLYGIVVVKTRGVLTYRRIGLLRIGLLRIPVVKSRHVDKKADEDTAQDQIAQSTANEAPMKEPDEFVLQDWDMLALQLVSRIEKLKPTTIIIR